MSAVPKEKLHTMKRLGIISFLGDDIELREINFLHHNIKSFSVESWKIDEYVQEAISKEITVQPGLTVVKVNYDHKHLQNLNFAQSKYARGSRNLQASVVDQISAIAKENHLDIVIVISYLGQPENPILPLGILKSVNGVRWWITSDMNVFDGYSLENIGRTWFSTPWETEIDKSYWLPSISSIDKLRYLENIFKNALKEELIIKLKYLGFIDSKDN
jgi:hypothetical protein